MITFKVPVIGKAWSDVSTLVVGTMRHNVRSDKFTIVQIKVLNYCRLYLQVVTVSDLCQANGTHIDAGYLSGYPTLLSSQTN